MPSKTAAAVPFSAGAAEVDATIRERTTTPAAESVDVVLRQLQERPKDSRRAFVETPSEKDREVTQCFTAAMKVAGIALWDWDIARGVLTFLNSYESLYGSPGTAGPLSSQESINLVLREDHASVIAAASRTIHTGADFHCEFRGRAPNSDGSPRWFVSHGHLRPVVGGRSSRIVGVTWEITDRVRTEQALQQLNEELERRVERRTKELLKLNADLRVQISERAHAETSLRTSEQRFREIVDTIHEVLWIATPEFDQILYVSPGYERVWGRSCDSLYAKPRSLLDTMYADDADAMLEQRREGRLFDREYRITHADGTIRWVWNRGFPIRDEIGRISRYIDVALDITDRKRIEDALRTHSQVLLSMSEAVTFLDERGLIQFTNPAFDTMFGYEPGELIGRPVTICKAATPEESERVISYVLTTIAEKRVWAGEFRNIKKDGTVFWTAAHISQVADDGVVRFVAIQQDITERKKADEQLASLTTQLAHASRLGTLGEMSAGLAHELNQPLTALCLYAAAARDAVVSVDSPQLKEYLRFIDEQALRAGEIIRRMRAFASRQSPRREPADVNQLLLEVTAILENDLRQSRVQTKLQLAEDLPVVFVDRIQIQQVVVNIIRNAIEAMLQLRGEVRRLTIRSQIEDRAIRVSISDTGAGLSPAIIETLFAPFQSTKSTGLGLGLAICRTLIEAHGGSIGVVHGAAPGATFYFLLPIPPDKPTDQGQPAS